MYTHVPTYPQSKGNSRGLDKEERAPGASCETVPLTHTPCGALSAHAWSRTQASLRVTREAAALPPDESRRNSKEKARSRTPLSPHTRGPHSSAPSQAPQASTQTWLSAQEHIQAAVSLPLSLSIYTDIYLQICIQDTVVMGETTDSRKKFLKN